MFIHEKRIAIRLLYLIGILELCLANTVAAEDRLPLGAILSDACTACHSVNSSNISIGPDISTYKAAELEKILKDSRDGKRPATLISRQAKIYTDEEIKLISSYIGAH